MKGVIQQGNPISYKGTSGLAPGRQPSLMEAREDADKAKAAQICEGAFFGPERATFLANQKATDRCEDKKLAFHCEEKDPLKRPCTTGRDDTCMDPDNDDIVSACREKATVLPYYTNVVAGCQIDCSLFVRGDALITCSVAPM